MNNKTDLGTLFIEFLKDKGGYDPFIYEFKKQREFLQEYIVDDVDIRDFKRFLKKQKPESYVKHAFIWAYTLNPEKWRNLEMEWLKVLTKALNEQYHSNAN